MDLVIRNGYLEQTDAIVDIGIDDNEIEAIESKIEASGTRELDVGGGLVSPGFIDAHFHTDMAFAAAGERFPNYNEQTYSRMELVGKSQEFFANESVSDLKSRIRRAVEQAVANGILHMRNHVYVDSNVGTKIVEATLEVRDELDDVLDMQIVAFPQQGFLRDPGSQDAARAALEMGADLVGGIDPASMNNNIEGTIATWFDIATDYGVDIDAHVHDRGTVGMYTLERLATETVERGYEGRVTASHCFSLADAAATEGQPYLEGRLEQAMETFAAADLRVVTCYQSTRPGMPIQQFHDNELVMAHGTDEAQDVWESHGNLNPLEAMQIASLKLRLASGRRWGTNDGLASLWQLITNQGAEILDIGDTYGIETGTPADLVVHNVASPQWAIIENPAPQYVIKNGHIVAEHEPQANSLGEGRLR
ncbi:amidohydrolase family protein (plasmid) [Haloferax prahovense]|uniref:amidohydrolase family protein n=1 Tax=Haloferax prahovense TaxID=381852 RepID=UPI003C752C69